MPANPRTVPLLLVAVALIAALGAFVLAAGWSRAEHSAACHEAQPFEPAPRPANHQCCASGHNWAIASAALSFHLATAGVMPEFCSDSGPVGADGLALATARPVFPSPDPPGAICLRI
jgi:hypothetical protein